MFSSLKRIPATSKHGFRQLSTATIIPAVASRRQLALPIAFLSVTGWGPPVHETWSRWANLFANEGYSSILLEIDPSVIKTHPKSSQALLDLLETDLTALLAKSDSPFPPLLISTSLSTLLAQTYVSSHPLSALLLHSPVHPPQAHIHSPSLFNPATPLKEFDYEPHFNLAVMEPKEELLGGRLLDNFAEKDDRGKVWGLVGGTDEEAWKVVMEWMDECGI